MADEEAIKNVVTEHRERFGRLDVLINNAGIGIGSAVADTATKKLDLQLDVNLRAVYLVARECIPMLKEAGAEHGKALIANTASIAGKHGQGWLSAYSATKFGVVGLSQGLHKELANDGIQVTALCPGFVATAMTDWVEGQVSKEEMIQPEDIAESIRFLLRTSSPLRRAGDPVHPPGRLRDLRLAPPRRARARTRRGAGRGAARPSRAGIGASAARCGARPVPHALGRRGRGTPASDGVSSSAMLASSITRSVLTSRSVAGRAGGGGAPV